MALLKTNFMLLHCPLKRISSYLGYNTLNGHTSCSFNILQLYPFSSSHNSHFSECHYNVPPGGIRGTLQPHVNHFDFATVNICGDFLLNQVQPGGLKSQLDPQLVPFGNCTQLRGKILDVQGTWNWGLISFGTLCRPGMQIEHKKLRLVNWLYLLDLPH